MPKAQRKSALGASPSTPTTGTGGLTVSALQNGSSYSKKVSVRVVKQSTTAPGESTLVTVILADSSGWIRALVPADHPKFVEGSSVLIPKCFIKDNRLRLYHQTTIYTGPHVDIPKNILDDCLLHHGDPIHPFSPIQAIKESSKMQIVSFRGTVVSNKQARSVVVNGQDVTVRDVQVEDLTGSMLVSLWRDSSLSPVEVGDDVEIRDVSVSYNRYYKQMTANANVLSQIQLDQEPKQKNISIWGIQNSSLEETLDVLAQVDGADTNLSIALELIKDNLQTQDLALDDFLSMLPLHLNVTLRGKTVVTIGTM